MRSNVSILAALLCLLQGLSSHANPIVDGEETRLQSRASHPSHSQHPKNGLRKQHFRLSHHNGLLKPDGSLKKEALERHVHYILAKLAPKYKASSTQPKMPEQDVPRKHSHPRKQRREVTLQLDARADYGGKAPSDGRLSVPNDGNFWSARATIGGVDIDAIIDTASGLTIVDGQKYTPGNTANDTRQSFSISFLDGSSSEGEVYTDTVSVAEHTFAKAYVCRDTKAFTIDNAAQQGVHGLLGVQRPGKLKAPTLKGLLDGATDLKEDVLALRLTKDGGEMVLGSIPQDWNTKDITYTPAQDNAQGHWQVDASLNSIQINGGAIIDTATFAVMANLDLATQLFNINKLQTEKSGTLTLASYPCDKPPALTVSIAGKDIKFDPATVELGKDSDIPNKCYWSLVGVPPGGGLEVGAILGASFMKNVDTLLDFTPDKHRIGIIPHQS